MKNWIIGLLVFLSFGSVGCAQFGTAQSFLATTKASYTPGGALSYESSKNQEGFKANLEMAPDGKLLKLQVETKATTPEAAIAAALESQKAAMEALNKILDKVIGSAGGIPIK